GATGTDPERARFLGTIHAYRVVEYVERCESGPPANRRVARREPRGPVGVADEAELAGEAERALGRARRRRVFAAGRRQLGRTERGRRDRGAGADRLARRDRLRVPALRFVEPAEAAHQLAEGDPHEGFAQTSAE